MDANKVWLQLKQSARLPDVDVEALGPARLEVALRVWLGDYSTALARCSEPALRTALEHFVGSLPEAQAASFTFFPRRAPMPQSEPNVAGVKIKCGTYKASDGAELAYVHLFPPGREAHPPPLMLRWGGNAEVAVLLASSPFCELVASGLLHIMLVDYRGFGWSDGSPSLAALRGDADAFYAALPVALQASGMQWPLAGPLIVMGRSVGAHCALHVALLHADDVSALVLDSPASCHWPMENIPGPMWGLLREQLPPLRAVGRNLEHCECCRLDGKQAAREAAWLDPVDLIRCLGMPLLVICGTADNLCPRPQIEELFQASPAAKKDLVWIAGKGHNEVSGTDTYWQGLQGFLESFSSRSVRK